MSLLEIFSGGGWRQHGKWLNVAWRWWGHFDRCESSLIDSRNKRNDFAEFYELDHNIVALTWNGNLNSSINSPCHCEQSLSAYAPHPLKLSPFFSSSLAKPRRRPMWSSHIFSFFSCWLICLLSVVVRHLLTALWHLHNHNNSESRSELS